MKKTVIIFLAIVLAAIGLRFGYSKYGQHMKAKLAMSKPAPNVVAEPVEEHSLIRTFEAPGRVTSKYRVDVLARISGYLLKSYFKEGDFVKAGQTLFLIEPTEYSNAAKVAKANVDNIQSQLIYAEKQLVRASELVKKDYIAKSQYDSILSQRDALKAQLSSAKAAYKDAQRNLGYTNVKSPVDGRIGIISVTVGNYVTPSAGALTTIYSTNPIYVTFPLDSNDYNMLAAGDKEQNTNRKVELTFNNGEKYSLTGLQDFQDNKIDQTTGTVTMRATFANPNNQLLHGEFVTIKLYSNKPVNVPVVHQVAVQENQAGKYVYKLDENDIPELVYIKTGEQDGDYWVVNSGLKAGDRVIVDGIQKVTPGKPVTLKTAEEMAKIKQSSNNTDKKGKK